MSKTMFVTARETRGNLTAEFAKKKGSSKKYPLSFSRYRALVNGSGFHMAADDEFAILLFPKERSQHCVQPTPLSLSSAETPGDNSRRG